ncbi:fatty acid desaturase family protein [Microbacterium lushaniae]|uniref:Acyl-CoA desaturase n=1 Tax=Microbacterium lushaniae TaxID=2614639 RepID=A0A5J6L7M1_9MICO|nr:acyl-CoA desaturase [Microbacterium lushaniae]QEW04455.1 acyl-CoA desaturase [Microbacterium lushaniae]
MTTVEPRPAPTRAARKGAHVNSDFTELAKTIQASGLMRRRYGYYWAKLIGLPVLVIAILVAFVMIGDTWWQLITAAVLGVVFTQVAFLGHDAAHRQIFVSGKWNDWTSLIIGDLFIGMSYGWWRHKHTRHHANPNKEGADPDIDLPVVKVTRERLRDRNRLVRWLGSHQGAFFFPILPLEGIALHVASVQRVLAREPVAHRWVEIVFLSIRLIGYGVLVFVVLSPGIAFAFLAVQLGVFGFYMGASFAPNHKGMPMVPKDAKLGFLERQVLTSRNIRGSRFIDIAMGGLNYQIEHHLFPSMPRPHLRKAARIVSEYCRSRNLPYTETGLIESYAIVIKYINRVGLSERDPFDCPLVAQRRAL